mgnify:CR=1 FL=1
MRRNASSRYEALGASPSFKVARLKNNLAALKKPYNLHVGGGVGIIIRINPSTLVEDRAQVNCVFSRAGSADITCEVQLVPRGVMNSWKQSHRLYTVSRAPDAAALKDALRDAAGR